TLTALPRRTVGRSDRRTDRRGLSDRPTVRRSDASFYGHTLREVPRLVHIAPPPHRDVVREQLERQHREHGREQVERLRHLDSVVGEPRDRKSTRLNSSHRTISYAVFCLKKKKAETRTQHIISNH